MTARGAAELLAYFTALAGVRRDLPGAAVLHAPGSPVVGANAAYVTTPEGRVRADLWFRAQGAPSVIASDAPAGAASPDGGREVLRLRVGTYEAQNGDTKSSEAPIDEADPPGTSFGRDVVVEQVSRLHLAAVADLLTAAWDVPEWSVPLSRSLATALELRRDFTLLVAYHDRPVGALLVLPQGAHLWGVTSPGDDGREVLRALLDTAAAGGTVRASLPTDMPLALRDERHVVFTLLT